MRRQHLVLAALAATALLFGTATGASAAPHADVDGLTRTADQVFEGRVEAVTVVRVGRDAVLYNDYRVRVRRVLRGDLAEGTRIVVRERAAGPAASRSKRSRRARRGDDAAPVASAELVAGQQVLLFVADGERASTGTLVRGAEGAWLIDETSAPEPRAYPVASDTGHAVPDTDAGVGLATLAARIEAAAR